jgi:hypothetical protein
MSCCPLAGCRFGGTDHSLMKGSESVAIEDRFSPNYPDGTVHKTRAEAEPWWRRNIIKFRAAVLSWTQECL